MTYRGIVKGNVIVLEDEATLPEGTRVSVIPEEQVITLKEWLEKARRVREQLPETSDSVEILRQLREGRASR